MEKHDFLSALPSNIKIEETPYDSLEVAKIFKTSNLLVLPVEFDEKSITAIRLSMPTKVPAYMASGTPILIYGPKKVSFVKHASQNGWAHVISSQSNLLSSLESFLDNKNLQRKVSENAIKISSEEFNQVKVQKKFRCELETVSIFQS